MNQAMEATVQLVREVLGDQYLDLRVDRFVLEEDVDTGKCTVSCSLHKHPTKTQLEIRGEGVGFVDAVFHALQKELGKRYPSLNSIQFSTFRVEARLDTRRERAGSDAVGAVVLGLQNSRGRTFEFSHSSRSITGSAMIVTLMGVEYFVNTERAFITLHKALDDARRRGRSDLLERYQIQIATIVENTSYSELMERIRAETSPPR
ncbi:MAG: hypothetical protein AMXMBFR64_29680 [Myxococcales bacterium]